MNAAHVAGAGIGAILGGILAAALKRYTGYTIDATSATLLVTAGLSIGIGLGHGLAKYGVVGLWRIFLYGEGAASPPPPPVPPVA